jgi:ABC-type multidrug transport system fused ATPase/permease subunit
MDKKLKMSLSIILGGYISSLGFYITWYWTKGYHLFNEMRYSDTYLLEIAAVVFAITVIYFFSLLLILFTKSLQEFWTCFFVVSIITILTFFLIPSSYYASYHFERSKEKVRIERAKEKIWKENIRIKELEAKLNEAIKKNRSFEKFNTGLQATLKSVREENVKLKRQLNEKIRKTKSLKEEDKVKEDVAVQAESNKEFSKRKINSEKIKTDSDTKNHGIIFKVQITSSSTPLAKNSSQFKRFESVWEYEDNGLYKYTVGNHKDLKSASDLQSELRRKGFSGAFVVAFKNGKRIPLREAMKLLN